MLTKKEIKILRESCYRADTAAHRFLDKLEEQAIPDDSTDVWVFMRDPVEQRLGDDKDIVGVSLEESGYVIFTGPSHYVASEQHYPGTGTVVATIKQTEEL